MIQLKLEEENFDPIPKHCFRDNQILALHTYQCWRAGAARTWTTHTKLRTGTDAQLREHVNVAPEGRRTNVVRHTYTDTPHGHENIKYKHKETRKHTINRLNIKTDKETINTNTEKREQYKRTEYKHRDKEAQYKQTEYKHRDKEAQYKQTE